MGIKLDDLNERYSKQAEAQLGNRTTVCRSGEKPGRQDALVQAPTCPQFRQAVHIHVRCWRARGNWDADNIETKSICDGLVAAGILSDDSINEVPRITKEGFRCKHKKEEKTIITIREV